MMLVLLILGHDAGRENLIFAEQKAWSSCQLQAAARLLFSFQLLPSNWIAETKLMLPFSVCSPCDCQQACTLSAAHVAASLKATCNNGCEPKVAWRPPEAQPDLCACAMCDQARQDEPIGHGA